MSLHVCNSVKSQSQFGVLKVLFLFQIYRRYDMKYCFGNTVYLTGVSLLTWIMYILCWDFPLLNEYDDKLLALLVFISSVILLLSAVHYYSRSYKLRC